MHAAALNLVRRGFEAHQDSQYQLPAWGVGLLVATGIVFFLMNASVEYTFGRLIPALVMVESPQAALVESADVGAPLLDEKHPLGVDAKATIEPELLLVKQTPITHTLCSTLRHIRSQAGCLARYRGLGAYMASSFATRSISNLLSAVWFMPQGFAPIVAALVTANLATTWTHVAISAPSDKHWIHRIPSVQSWKKVAGPTFFMALATQMTLMVPMYLAGWLGMLEPSLPSQVNALSMEERQTLIWKGLGVALAGLTMAVLFVIPAKVTLTRVQASTLKEEEETIVPFDKSFNGKVVSESLGGTGVVSARDAWRSFSSESRLTLAKTYAKLVAMETFLIFAFAVTICAELVMIMGDDIRRFIPKDGEVVLSL